MDFQHDLKTFSEGMNADGSWHISYSGSCVVLPKIDFNSLLQNAEKSTELMRQMNDRIKILEEINRKFRAEIQATEENAKEFVSEDYLTSHRGGYDKQGCGDRADAEILARAIQGATIKELLESRYTYDRLGHKRVYGRRKIFSALSVKKPEDYERITRLYAAYPEVFHCTTEELFVWYKKRYEKGGKKK